jgi:DNA-binding YbaB/EbfC family protein
MQPGDPGGLGAFGQQVPPQMSPEAVQGLQQLQAAMVQAQQMQHALMHAQEEIAQTEVTGSAGGGVVQVCLNGSGQVHWVWLDPEVVNPHEVETLQDLIVAAMHNAAENMRDKVKEILGPLAAASGRPLPES